MEGVSSTRSSSPAWSLLDSGCACDAPGPLQISKRKPLHHAMQKQRRLFRCWWQSSWRATPLRSLVSSVTAVLGLPRRKSISSWAADLLFMAASFHATMCYVSFWIRSTLNAWVGSHLAPFFARRGSGSKMLVFSVDLTFCCCCGNVTSATTCSSCFPAFPCSATMAAPFFQPEDDGHILFSHYLSCTVLMARYAHLWASSSSSTMGYITPERLG